MCFGGGDDKYDAYKSGDFAHWKSLFDQQHALQEQLALGKIDAKHYLAAVGKIRTPIAQFGTRIKNDPSAGMEMREVLRQGDVGLGKIGIDKQFGKFDDGYYDKYKNAYTGYYMPNLQKQFGDAQDKLTANLADRGMLASSVGGTQFANLSKENADAKANIANEANDAAKKLRGTVENAKTSLYSLNEASANPQSVNAQAIGQSTALVAPPTYSPLGQVFASFLSALPTFNDARAGTTPRRYTSPYTTPSGYGSGSVVG